MEGSDLEGNSCLETILLQASAHPPTPPALTNQWSPREPPSVTDTTTFMEPVKRSSLQQEAGREQRGQDGITRAEWWRGAKGWLADSLVSFRHKLSLLVSINLKGFCPWWTNWLLIFSKVCLKRVIHNVYTKLIICFFFHLTIYLGHFSIFFYSFL